MPLNISSVTQNGLVDSAKSALLDNNIAAAFGLNSKSDNLLQFHNRFGTNSVFLPDKKTFIIRTQNYFSVGFKFIPGNSKVLNLFSQSLMEKTPEDLKYFVQEVNLPNIRGQIDRQTIGSGFMEGSIPGHIVIPSARTFDISFLHTEFSLHEHCFYYWLKETMSNQWIYTDGPVGGASEDLTSLRPFSKADILISFTCMKTNEPLHSIILTDCFPIEIKAAKIDQKMDPEIARTVTFAFNNIYVSSPFVGANWQKKLRTNVIEDVFNSYIGNKISNAVTVAESNLVNSFENSTVGNLARRQ
jgi:hypothetical protein